jgi:uncharacterized protein YbaR (Trm112 family)
MIESRLIDILRCPQDRTRLHAAAPEMVVRINRAIGAGAARNFVGERLEKPLDGGLVREAGDLLYPIVDQIPVMLPDEAIDLGPYREPT